MKTNKKGIATQRQIIDKKLGPWLGLRDDKKPPAGWLKAIRGALGINTRQLAERVGGEHSAILRTEVRESAGKVTLEQLDKVARAMNCRLVYAIVPENSYQSLEAILDERAKEVAVELIGKVEHSMRLEAQGSADIKKEVERLSYDLKAKMDSRIWNKSSSKKSKPK